MRDENRSTMDLGKLAFAASLVILPSTALAQTQCRE